MTYSKKQKITENNQKHSNRPVGRCSGPFLDIFGSTEPWTHALLQTFQRKKLNLNILRSKIEICAQNSAFLRKKGPHIAPKNSEPKQPTDDRTTSTFRDENPHWKPAPSGTQFFKKSKKRSETRFGPLLMSSGRLVLFSGESEHFFFRRKCEIEN